MKKHITKKIEKLKQRPEHERKKIATIFAGVATLIIIILSLALSSIFKTKKVIHNNTKLTEFGKVFDNIGEQFSEIGTQFKEQKENLDSIQEQVQELEEQEKIPTEIKSEESKLTETNN